MLVSDAITQAFRDANLMPAGTTPKTNEVTEALFLLNAMYLDLLGHEVGEKYSDWLIPPPNNLVNPPDTTIVPPETLILLGSATPWYNAPQANSRMLVAITTPAQNIYFPLNPSPGARMMYIDVGSTAVTLTLQGNGRLIEGNPTLSVATPTSLNGVQWFYRDDKSSWERIVPLVLTGQLPFESRHDDLFITLLARRLMPRNAYDPKALLEVMHKENVQRAAMHYKQYVPTGIVAGRTSQSQQAYGNLGDWP